MKDRQGEKFIDIIDNENDHYEQEIASVESDKQIESNVDDNTPKKEGENPKNLWLRRKI